MNLEYSTSLKIAYKQKLILGKCLTVKKESIRLSYVDIVDDHKVMNDIEI